MFQDDGIAVLSIDGYFGLCCKISAGTSVRKPLQDTFVLDQSSVDDYISSYKSNETVLKVCFMSHINILMKLDAKSCRNVMNFQQGIYFVQNKDIKLLMRLA